MEKEFETQVLDIDVDEIIKKLRSIGAKEEPEVLQRRWVFDIVPCTVESTGTWIRLRQVGDKKPTICYKNRSGKGLDETEEIEVEVADFDKTAQILAKADFRGQYYQENRRHKFTFDQIEFCVDSWPMIPPIIEIEGTSIKEVKRGLKLLGLENKENGHFGTVTIFKRYGLDLHSFKELKL